MATTADRTGARTDATTVKTGARTDETAASEPAPPGATSCPWTTPLPGAVEGRGVEEQLTRWASARFTRSG
jgi:hypothetical protein